MIKPKHTKSLFCSQPLVVPGKIDFLSQTMVSKLKEGRCYCSLGSRLLAHEQQNAKLTKEENVTPNISCEMNLLFSYMFLNSVQRTDNDKVTPSTG